MKLFLNCKEWELEAETLTGHDVNKNPIILPEGYSLVKVEVEAFWSLTEELMKKIFIENGLMLNVREILSEIELLKLEKLNSSRPRPFSLAYVLYFNNQIAGWSYGYQDGRDTYYMQNSAILPEHQKKGLYSKLLKFKIEMLTQLGFQKIWSRHVMTNNSILIPKLKNGFVITGTELTDAFGVLVHLSYFTNPLRKKILIFRAGDQRPDEEINKAFHL